MTKKKAKNNLNFLVLVGALFAVISIILFLSAPVLTSHVVANANNYTDTVYKGAASIFGGDLSIITTIVLLGNASDPVKGTVEVAFNWGNFIMFLLLVLGLVASVLAFLKKKSKLLVFVAGALFIVAGILAFFTVSFFTGANGTADIAKDALKLGVAPITTGILSILGGLVTWAKLALK